MALTPSAERLVVELSLYLFLRLRSVAIRIRPPNLPRKFSKKKKKVKNGLFVVLDSMVTFSESVIEEYIEVDNHDLSQRLEMIFFSFCSKHPSDTIAAFA